MNARTKKFLSYYRPYRRLLAVVLLCSLAAAAIGLILPLGVRYITKTVLAAPQPDVLAHLTLVGLGMLALTAVQALCIYIFDYHGHAMGALMERDLRNELFDHYQKLSFRFYDGQKTGQLMSRITNDLLSLAEMYHHGPEDVVINTVRLVGALVILLGINAQLTLVVFLFLPPMTVFAVIFNRKMHAALKRNHKRIGDINAQVEDSLAGIRVVKSFANETIEQAKFHRENERFLHSRKAVYWNEAVFDGGLNTFINLIQTAVMVLGGMWIVGGAIDLADLITFLLYVSSFTDPIRKFLHVAMQYQEGVTGFERFMEILEIEPDVQDAPGAREIQTVAGRVAFRQVAFRYHPEQPDVLANINLTVEPGEYVALVGSSGVGKTTLCSLIPRFYDVTAGEVLIDEMNVQDVTLRSLRRHIGVVQQDVYLFAGTVLENIRYGNPQASLEEVVAAAQQANAHDFILSLPDGYHTDIGQRGVKLSGGQKQRLSIARVFLKDPAVLIFDEATSSLDSESEKVVQESLERLARNRTTLVIAHRLSTIRNADRIVVLTDQGIAEQGSHRELLGRDGLYARFYQMQFADELEDEARA